MFPTGPYFPGFTLSVTLMGLVCGALLYKHEVNIWRTILAVGICQFVIALFLTTYWIHLLYGFPYWVKWAERLVQVAVISAAQLVIIPILGQVVKRLDKSLKLREA